MIKIKNPSNLDTVVQHNTIIEATHRLNKNEILAFKKIISMVDTKYRKREIIIKKQHGKKILMTLDLFLM